MGNVDSKSANEKRGEELKTWALSQQMHLGHDQLLDLRDECLRVTPTASPSGPVMGSFLDFRMPNELAAKATLSRQHLTWALNEVLLGGDWNPSEEQSTGAIEFYTHRRRVTLKKDYDVILDLYTIWDMFGTDAVPALSFVVSLTILACQESDTLRSMLQLALDVYDVQESGIITASELVKVLQSLNSTIAIFGDASLSQCQIHEIVHDVVEYTSRIRANRPAAKTCGVFRRGLNFNSSKNGPPKPEKLNLMHSEVVTILAGQPMIQNIMTQKLDKQNYQRGRRRVAFSSDTKDDFDEGITSVVSSQSSHAQSSSKRSLRVRFSPGTKDPRLSASKSFNHETQFDEQKIDSRSSEYDDDESSRLYTMEANSSNNLPSLVWHARESWDDLKSLAMDSITSNVSSLAPYYQKKPDEDDGGCDESKEAKQDQVTLSITATSREDDDRIHVFSSSSSVENSNNGKNIQKKNYNEKNQNDTNYSSNNSETSDGNSNHGSNSQSSRGPTPSFPTTPWVADSKTSAVFTTHYATTPGTIKSHKVISL